MTVPQNLFQAWTLDMIELLTHSEERVRHSGAPLPTVQLRRQAERENRRSRGEDFLRDSLLLGYLAQERAPTSWTPSFRLGYGVE